MSISSHNKGFTLIETLVAISILVIAVFGAFTAVQNGLSVSIFSKDEIVAFYLAQEAVEQVRNIRDENTLATRPSWLTGIAAQASDPCWFGKTCMVNVLEGNGLWLTECTGTIPGVPKCPNLTYEPTNGYYGYVTDAPWIATTFNREVTLTKLSDQEISMLVTIRWSKGSNNQVFQVRENLLDWQ